MILSSIHRNGKAIFVIAGLLLMTTLGYSQTGIGTTEPDPDAQLEISATNKGVLIPRIELAGTDSVAPLSSHVAGMIVYNTITAGSGSTAVVPGFYYNDGTKWVRTLGAGEVIAGNSGLSSGTGAPNATNPASPDVGDLYIDESTGDVYAYANTDGDGVGDTWENQNDVVSGDDDNIIIPDANGLAYLSATELGLYTGEGVPTGSNPTDTPEAGDLYVDETTGDIFTYNSTTNIWENQSDTLANNGLSVDANNTVQLGGTLIQPTTITTDATNTLAVAGLQTAAADYYIMVVDNNTGVVHKVTTEDLKLTRYVQKHTADAGQINFSVPQPITISDLDKMDVYRNGVRVDVEFVDVNTVKLDLGGLLGCYAGDQIRIFQLQ